MEAVFRLQALWANDKIKTRNAVDGEFDFLSVTFRFELRRPVCVDLEAFAWNSFDVSATCLGRRFHLVFRVPVFFCSFAVDCDPHLKTWDIIEFDHDRRNQS